MATKYSKTECLRDFKITAVGRRRLLKLAEFLRTNVKPEWFDMETWADHGWTEKKCGTAACAFGWSTVVFPRLLEIKRDSVFLKGSRTTGFDAAAKVFQTTLAVAGYLFDPNSYACYYYEHIEITPKMVAKRIEKFCGGWIDNQFLDIFNNELTFYSS